MKKNISHILLILVLLTSCQFIPVGRNNTFLSKAFEFDKQCPHICWLGINPGKTKAEQAESLIMASDQIDQKSVQVTNDGILAVWMADTKKDFKTIVGIQFENGLVNAISFGQIPFTMNDFIKLLGEPEDIIAWDWRWCMNS